jgi:hypothetical protein
MKWIKKGKIFDPSEHPELAQFVGYAQSPQALVLDDRVRIYFSIRKSDSGGKFLSHVSFVDFDLELRGILGVANSPVIELGKLGTFDEHGIFPFSPLKDGNRIVAYTCGWSRRGSVSVETSTGLAVSHDNGLTFSRVGDGPIMSSSLHEPFLVGDSFVRVFNGVYHMWYIFGIRWSCFENEGPPDRVYKIAHATSTDGIHFTPNGKAIIADKLHEDECQALPSVIYHTGLYHMVFCYREAVGFRKEKSRGYRLGYAYSSDLLTWTRDDDRLGIAMADEGWDSEMMCYPHFFSCSDEWHLLYNGNEFGKHGFGLATLVR